MLEKPDKPEDGATTLHRLNIYLEPAQLNKLAGLQHQTGASLSYHVRKAIDAYNPKLPTAKR